ncbi:helix-turn-helix domain-containing protein [Paracidovorax cattleyae]|uniref:helix-turn-helix domain-containing protein n=1 Tax=Paracidovorax cattleyae TaxID=80868 RepID=UPI0018AFE76E|nr:helix-turn-helix transcriptional regulator [Paracidovorax cattleyae]MBF9263583.1 helix-turn-helix transcriptional regulator [Paracidovorax cattleyae]
MEEIHIRLRAELDELGLSAAQAARDSHCDSQGLRDVLSGRKRLSAELLGALVQGTGIDSHYVLTGERAGGLSSEEKLMLQYFREASKDTRRAALGALLGATIPTQVGGTHSQHSTGDGAIQIGTISGGAVARRRR